MIHLLKMRSEAVPYDSSVKHELFRRLPYDSSIENEIRDDSVTILECPPYFSLGSKEPQL